MLGADNILVRFLFLCIILASALVSVRPAAADQRVALVIGNSAYPSARLRNSINDANAIAQKLRALGFEVTLSTNATQREMSRAISEFGKQLKLGSIALFYFAGHGMQLRGKNFLIPIDAEIETEGAVRGEAVDVDHVLDQLGSAQLSMVILDACRNNPFESRFRRASSGLAQIDAPTGSLLAYATAPGKVASDGTGSNGLYTAALLKALDVPGLKVEDVFKQVRNEVIKESANAQIPWESSSLTVEFFFRPGTQSELENAKLQQFEKARAELLISLEEERKKREREAQSVKREMEQLRAELLKLKDSSSQPVQASAASDVVPVQASTASDVVPVPGPVALVATSLVSFAPEWAVRMTLFERSRGQLTFSKAMALLLEINNAEGLTSLLLHEEHVRSRRWHNALAIGTDVNGNLIWGGGHRLRTAPYAGDTALEQCTAAAGDSCKLVMLDGDFREKDFLDMAKRLGGRSISDVRQAYLQSLTRPVTETRVGLAGGPVCSGEDCFSYGYAPSRQ